MATFLQCWPLVSFLRTSTYSFCAGNSGGFLAARLVDTAHDHEEISCGQAAHEDAHQALDRSEHPPRLRQHDVAVAKRGVGGPGKVERRFGVGQASTP